MSRYKITLFLIAITLLVGCQKDPLIPDGGKVVEGVKTSLKIKIALPQMEVKTRAVLPDDKEKEVISIAVFIFDQTGSILSSAMHESVVAHVEGGKLGIDTDAYMHIPAISGPDRQIYAIANYDANQIENLKSVATLNDLKALVVNLYGNPIYREFGMVKIGHATTNIQTDGTVVSIQLEYLSAKITLKVINKSSDLIVRDWSIGNIPLKTYLLERDYDATNPNKNDAADHNNEKDFYNDFSELSLPFDKSDTPGVGTAEGKNYEVSFYLTENRQGVLPLDKRKPLEPPYVGLSSTDYKIKSWDAPKTASYITIIGQQNPGSANQKAILIKHYLGENSYDNYNVCRGVHYTYIIKINSLNEIVIDTNVESYEEPIFVEQGADFESLDSHASFRVVEIHTEQELNPAAKISIELANFANSTDYPDWLKLSLVPLASSQIVDPSSDDKIKRWQQEGNSWSYVRTKFIPHSSKRTDSYPKPFPDFSFFGTVGSAPVLSDAENPDLVAGKSAYPAYDNELPCKWAMRRMCNKITDIPTNTSLPTRFFLYADEYEIDGSDDRSAVLRIIYELNGIKTIKVYRIVQKAPIQFMGLPGENTIMVVENTEEYAHLLQNGLAINLQMLAGLQWGDYQGIASSQTDGELNTLQGVYSSVTDKNDYSVNTYLKKYGGMAGGWSSEKNAEITEGTPKHPIVGGDFYSFYEGTNDYYNSTYNSTAARYCHEKNWDKDGNGQIDPTEAKWYLPSQQELQLFWTYHEKLKLNTDYYWSSTSATDAEAYAISIVESSSDPRYVYNGTQQKLSKIPIVGHNRPRVRCVKRVALGGNVKRYMPMVIYENKSLLIDCSNLTSEMYTTQSKYGLSQNNPGSLQKANAKVYKKLLVQLNQPAAEKYSALHLNGGKCDESKGWRLPTQRELLLIWSVKDRIDEEARASFAPFKDGLYWTMNRDLTKQYVIDFTTGLAQQDDYSLGGSQALNYRCVKEIK